MNFEWTAIVDALPDLLQGLELTMMIALAASPAASSWEH